MIPPALVGAWAVVWSWGLCSSPYCGPNYGVCSSLSRTLPQPSVGASLPRMSELNWHVAPLAQNEGFEKVCFARYSKVKVFQRFLWLCRWKDRQKENLAWDMSAQGLRLCCLWFRLVSSNRGSPHHPPIFFNLAQIYLVFTRNPILEQRDLFDSKLSEHIHVPTRN